MNLTVVIPTTGRSPASDACLAALAAQQTSVAWHVVVSVDDAHAEPPNTAPLSDVGIECALVRGDRSGPAAARNRALALTRGEFVLFLNDDVISRPDLIDAHLAAHRAADQSQLVLGSAPWRFDWPVRVIDRVVRDTSWVFFYDQMDAVAGADPGRDWGFRHAWTLNLSLPRAICQPFDERLRFPMFDDLEWAYRVTRAHQQEMSGEHEAPENDAPALVQVRYHPSASVEHAHQPYTSERLLAREVLIGHQAWVLYDIAPECARATFNAEEPGFCAPLSSDSARDELIEHAAERFSAFARIAEQPEGALGSSEAERAASVRSLFESSRIWRDAARMLGWESAEACTRYDLSCAFVSELFKLRGGRHTDDQPFADSSSE